MIRVSLPEIIALYLLVVLSVVFAVWAGSNIVRRWKSRRAREFKVLCTICGVIYEDKTENPLPKCPRCDSVNERLRIREI